MTELMPNDVVSLNMAHYRQAAGLSQQELADKLGWPKSLVSTAERTWEASRKRNFTANDIAELAAGLGIPVGALFIPPPEANAGHPPLFDPTDPECPVAHAYRDRLARAGLSGGRVADADELTRQAEAFRSYRAEWRGELVGMLERLTEAARSLLSQRPGPLGGSLSENLSRRDRVPNRRPVLCPVELLVRAEERAAVT